jgi:hypothetical protein
MRAKPYIVQPWEAQLPSCGWGLQAHEACAGVCKRQHSNAAAGCCLPALTSAQAQGAQGQLSATEGWE